MHLSRLFSILLALNLAGAAFSASAEGPPLPTDPRKRLEALQNALVQAAMDGQTRVRTAAWVDSTGKLHENTRITSDMKVNGVRVTNYLQSEDGVSAAIIAEGKGITPSEEVCRANLQRYRREATLDVASRITSSGADQYYWQTFLKQTRARFVARVSAGRKWQLSKSAVVPENTYERQLTGAVPDISPYQMLIEVLPSGAAGIEPVRPAQTREQQIDEKIKAVKDYLNDEPPRRAPVPFVLRLTIVERGNQRLLWQDAVPLFFPEQEIRHTSQPLPPGLLSELDNVIGRWQQRLDTDFGCRPQTFNVMQETGKGWLINGGKGAGLSVGDQLLLMNREYLPAHILEPDSAEHLALVEVVSVGGDSSVVRKLAGPNNVARSGDWVATPF